MFGAIEAGGTKFVCAVGSSPEALKSVSIPTRTPAETLERVADFYKRHLGSLQGIGIGSFGPVDLDFKSSTYGYITSTPKPDWGHTALLASLREKLNDETLPLAFDTDVNAAALGEAMHGAARGLDNFVYFTVGTGVGGGVIANSQFIHGGMHTELGHILLPKHPDDKYQGHCPYHADRCFEGLACGPAISERWACSSHDLPPDHPAWELQAWYMGAALCSVVCSFAPQRVIFGGGVMQMEGLMQKVRHAFAQHFQGYMQYAALNNLETFIVAPALENLSGIVGAWELIRRQVSNL